jgi:hypothetical protein
MNRSLRNVAPAKALARRARRLIQLAFVTVSAGIFFAIVGLALYVVPLTAQTGSAFALFDAGRALFFYGGVLIALVGVGLAVRAVTWRREIEPARQTGRALVPHLDSRYMFIRNLSRRGLGYVDAVLVGPAGILVFRTVDMQGTFLNEATKWLRGSRDGWQPMRLTSPTEELIDDMRSMREYLARVELYDIPIFGIVVFTQEPPLARFQLKDPVMPVTHLSQLPARLREFYLNAERLNAATVQRIEATLYEG